MNQAVERIERPQVPAVVTPPEMLDRALQAGLPPETLEKFMALAERWEASQSRKAFDAALSAAKSEIPVIIKNSTGHNDKRYANLAAIAKAVDPILSAHGLSYRFRSKQDEKIIHVTCILSHAAGHSEENTLAAAPDTSGNKNAIQAIGSALTYLQRYSLVQALGLAASEDDDGKAANGGAAISEEDAQNLRDMLASVGAPEARFLKWAKVQRIEDIRADHYDSCVDAIKSFKKA